MSDTMAVADVGVLPVRTGLDDVDGARQALERDGAVVVTDLPTEPESVVRTAAAVLGVRLRRVEHVERRTTHDAGALPLHRDGTNVIVSVGGRYEELRSLDIDHVYILCARRAPVGGENVVLDGYAVAEHVRRSDPDLHRFLSTTDVDLTSAIQKTDVHPVPVLGRLLEYTRGGRLIVRPPSWVTPAPRVDRPDDDRDWIARWDATLQQARAATSRRVLLAEGELLMLDNHRCLHGVDPHEGPRTTLVGRTVSDDAR